jgi:hypothetical protein
MLQSPGPGAYEPKKEVIKSKNPAVDFSKGASRLKGNKNDSPGPGAYNHNHKSIGQLS